MTNTPSSPATALIATDLDRTMIYSRGAMGEDRFAEGGLLCVEYYEGVPLSYVSEAAAIRLRGLASALPVVPTTTRTPAQFNRIDLPGGPWPYAITSNGGAILVDGEADASWRHSIDDAVRASSASLDDVTTELRRRISDEWVSKFRIAEDLFCYLVVDAASQPRGFMSDWSAWCTAHGWNASQQGRKIYTMPDPVCKSRAVAEVHRRLTDAGLLAPGSPVFAAGDGALDAEMLASADAAIRPRHGELESLDWQHPTLTITEQQGIAAGEEILDWFTRSASVPVAS
ncbi:hypothetical protein EV641_12429 [Rhodococcus sp. SMB37]|nr:hypothetical protein EV641_12429 [Rhodococcus sp. SMB37]